MRRVEVGARGGAPKPESAHGPSAVHDAALGALLRSVRTDAPDRRATFVVAGEAGIGKTHLVEEALRRARQESCSVLSGRAHDYDRGVAYSSLKDVLASASHRDLDGLSASSLKQLLEAIDRVVLDGKTEPGGGSGDRDDPKRGATQLALTTALLRELASRRPTIVALDDAHLADEESLTALAIGLRHASALPLVLMFTVRSDMWGPGTSFASTLGKLLEPPTGRVIELEPLALEPMGELVESELGQPADRALVSYVFSRSRGNPLFAREVLMSLREQRVLRTDHGRCYLLAEPVAPSVSRRSTILHRMFNQDPDARRLARAMSALRRIRLDQVGLLGEVTGLDPEHLQRAFDGLVRACIVMRSESGWYEFTHPLLAEVLYEDLGPFERRRLHGLVSEQLVGDGGAADGMTVLEWATHVTEAAAPGDEDAVQAAIAAATLTRESAPLSAAGWYARALDLLPPGSQDRPALTGRRAVALWWGSRPDQAATAGRVALSGLGPGRERDETLSTVVTALYGMGRYAEALELLGSELEPGAAAGAGAGTGAGAERAPLLAQRAVLMSHMGHGREAARSRDRALELLRGRPDDDPLTTYGYIAYADDLLGRCDASRGVDALVRLGRETDGAGERGALVPALETAAYVLGQLGRVREAGELLMECPALLDRSGWRGLGGQSIFAAAFFEYESGSWTLAMEMIRSGAIQLEFEGFSNNLAWLRLLEVEILKGRGQLDEALAILHDETFFLDCPLFGISRELHLAQIAWMRGDNDRALEITEHQRARLEEASLVVPLWQALVMLFQLHVDAGRADRAREVAEELVHLAASSPRPVLYRAADLVSASACLDAAPARRALESSVLHASRVDEAKAHLVLGSLHDDPDVHLNRAMEMFDDMGATTWTGHVAAAAHAQGVRLEARRRSSGPPGDGARRALTPRETDLVRLIGQGMSNRQIASALNYSQKTVEIYLSRLYRKLGCRSRYEAIGALRRGDLDVEG